MIVHLSPWPPLLAGLAVLVGMCVVPPLLGGVVELEIGGRRVAWTQHGYSYQNERLPKYVVVEVQHAMTDPGHAHRTTRTLETGRSGIWPWSRYCVGPRRPDALRVDSRGNIHGDKTSLSCHGNECEHLTTMTPDEYLTKFPNGPLTGVTQ